jgi:hypothetical protein
VEAPTDRPIDGESLLPVLGGGVFRRTRPLYWEFDDFYNFHFALRDGRWKLVTDKGFGKALLFDLVAEPFEVVDRAADRPEVTERLLGLLKQRAADVQNDPLRPRLPDAP